ncbi:MAG: prolyl aminopeptidase [Alphaproteobacteria bacterium]|nr:MAG: prolyl aminopeptidase [Alphaproteobacteria bacterium]
MTNGFRSLYPEIAPYRNLCLVVGNGHELYVEESGNPDGAPVIYLHGGPGGATHPNFRRFFDPDHYRIILFDQRGCGKSTPLGRIEANTTWHILDDLEQLRETLDIERWHLFGGSWGSMLALAYAQRYRDRVASLVLRSVFLGRRQEIDWLFGGGAARFFPDEWAQLSRYIPDVERNDLVRAYYRRLVGPDEDQRLEAALNWCRWESALLHLSHDPGECEDLDPDQALALARLETHYFTNGCFLPRDDQILRDVTIIRDLPAIIVQGRYDMITPPYTAVELVARWPKARLELAPLAGHAASEPALVHHLVEATDAMRAITL